MLQQVLVGKAADADEFLAGQAVPHGQHHEIRLVGDGTHLEPVPVDRQPDVADIRPPVVQHLRLVGPAGANHLDGELGVGGGECPHGVGDDQPGMKATVNWPALRAAWATRLCRAAASASSG
jgi:hypothetical protein